LAYVRTTGHIISFYAREKTTPLCFSVDKPPPAALPTLPSLFPPPVALPPVPVVASHEEEEEEEIDPATGLKIDIRWIFF